jgi:hypothetical protein
LGVFHGAYGSHIMLVLTDDLKTILRGKLQAGATGFHGRAELEVTTLTAALGATRIQSYTGIGGSGSTTVPFASATTPGNLLVVQVIDRSNGTTPPTATTSGWDILGTIFPFASTKSPVRLFAKLVESGNTDDGVADGIVKSWTGGDAFIAAEYSGLGLPVVASIVNSNETGVTGGTTRHVEETLTVPAGGAMIAVLSGRCFGANTMTEHHDNEPEATVRVGRWADNDWPNIMGEILVAGSQTTHLDFSPVVNAGSADMAFAFPPSAPPTETTITSYPINTISKDKSRRMASAELDVVLDIEEGTQPIEPGSGLLPTARIRIYQWFGDDTNEVQTFDGLVDSITEDRDPDGRTMRITARDRMKLMIEDKFVASDPQGADEEGAIRTPANGVYLEMEAKDIINDILDRAAWPAADRNIADTHFWVEEYILDDGGAWIDQIMGEEKLLDLMQFEARADEQGVFQCQPSVSNRAADSDTAPVPDYSYIIGDTGSTLLINPTVLHLTQELDDEDLRTRVKVRATKPGKSKVVWNELWRTREFRKPVGIWYDPTDIGFIKVLDAGTKKVYRFRDSEKKSERVKVGAGIWPLDISADVSHPLGLSGDPADSDRFWVLDAHWRYGASNNASVHKYDASSGVHLAEYSIPDGQWSDLKVTSNYLVLTNYGTDKVHLRSKVDGSAVSNHTVVGPGGNNQTKPTGVFVNQTLLGLFFATHARFLLVDESDPSTLDPSNILNVNDASISTAGTNIFGGEMDTTTDAHLFACVDSAGIVYKYELLQPTTKDIVENAIDADLEDELGLLAGLDARHHAAHEEDADHPFEIRRETVEVQRLLDNRAQARAIAWNMLEVMSHRREVLDIGIVGNPGHQIHDLIKVTDPVTGIDMLWILDTIQDDMDAKSDSFVGVASLIPYEPRF